MGRCWGTAIGLVIIATSCGGSSRRSDNDDGASGAGAEAGETARGGTAQGGTTTGGTTTGGTSGRGGSGRGGEATGGTDGGESGNPAGQPGSGAGGGAGMAAAGGLSGRGGTGGSSGSPGGRAGAGGKGGAAGAGTTGPFACDMPMAANCGTITDFPNSTAQTWGSADFSGGFSVYGSDLRRDTTTAGLHVTGTVSGAGRGFLVWFTRCSTLAAYAGITFTLSGTTTDVVTPNTVSFEIQTNANFPWQPYPLSNAKGECTAPMGTDPWSVCIPASLSVSTSETPTFVSWAQMAGGSPTSWSASQSPAEILGFAWNFPWTTNRQPYEVNVTLDKVQFTGGSGPTTVCPPFAP